MFSRGFSCRKTAPKSPRPHIRKISFSGSSVGSWDDASSTCSSAATPTMASFSPRMDTSFESNSTATTYSTSQTLHNAPPRLADRAYLRSEHKKSFTTADRSASYPSTFFHDDEEDEHDVGGYGYGHDTETMELPLHAQQPWNMALPPAASPSDHTSHEVEQPQDYFLSQLARRPPMPKSHWSYSTVHTMQSTLDDMASASGTCTPSAYETDCDDVDEDSDEEDKDDINLDDFEMLSTGTATPPPTTTIIATAQAVRLPNFSYKRPTTMPQRPSVQSAAEKVDAVSKQRGWKRRGVVFNKEEAGSDDEEEYFSTGRHNSL